MFQLRTLNKELSNVRPGFELVRGEGYFYIDGPNTELWYTTSIYVYQLNHMSFEQWMETITDMIDRNA